MGTQEGERDWVDVANDLLSKCHIDQKLKNLTDCDANVFIVLYENILGEKVPDYIAAPCSQEDDVHNVQSVIDSLSLDYLQISLSHITGENVVRGNIESIKNLLEIFDGLLEYLNEEISEDLHNGEELHDSLSEFVPGETKETDCDYTEEKEAKLDCTCLSSNEESAATSSKHSLYSWNAEEVGSTSELIGLGVSARTFTDKQEATPVLPETTDAKATTGPQNAKDAPVYSAASIQPLTESKASHRSHSRSPSPPPTTVCLSNGHAVEEAKPVNTETPRELAEPIITNGLSSPPLCQSPTSSEKSLSGHQRARMEIEGEMLEPTNGGPRRVLFRTQPDVLFLTLQDETMATTPSPPITDEELEEDLNYIQKRNESRAGHKEQTGLSSSNWLEEESLEDPLPFRRQRNRKAEKELHDISEKLSHRLEELDQMLKRVLEESGVPAEVREEDKQSHHSDSVMECHRTPRQQTGTVDPESTHRTRSLSPSPPWDGCSPLTCSIDITTEAVILNDGRQTQLTACDHAQQSDPHYRQSLRKPSKVDGEELKTSKCKERTDLDKERRKALEAERQYREAILQDVSKSARPSLAQTKVQHKAHHKRNTQATPGRTRQDVHRRAPKLTVRQNELLPVLMEEMPHLHISPHTLGRMWEQQMQQVDRLHSLSSHSCRRSKLSSQLDEAQKKHDLLAGILHKEQDHSRRLRDFKERIQQQKLTQNRLRDQRQQVARARKYHQEYHVQHRARMMRARTKEERMFRQLFEEGLEVQKVRLREQRALAREQRLEHQRRHQDQIKSMENYYRDQFSILAEKLAQERQEIQIRKKAQEKALLKMKRELRSRMEREIGELQKIIVQNDEDDFFVDLEVERLRRRVQTASFHYNTSYLR